MHPTREPCARPRHPFRVARLGMVLLLGWISGMGPWATAGTKPSSAPALSPSETRLLERMAREGTNSATLYALGDLCHDAGVDGDKQAVLRAEEYLRRLLEKDPSHGPAWALLGSVYTMKGRDAFWPTAQLKLVREGNAFMDRGVELDPDNIRARVTRAFNNAHMPDFLGRNDIVVADLEWLWAKVRKEPASFSVSERQETALHWGRRLKRRSRTAEARQVWEAGLAFAPHSPMAIKIQDELDKLR